MILLFSAEPLLKMLSCIKKLLDEFSNWSSQIPNPDKSMVHFSSNTNSQTKLDILNTLGFMECTHNTKHLGLLFYETTSRKIAFSDISDKISSSLKGWKAKLLSQANRTILIKAVAQALPIYAMSSSLFPIHVTNNLDAKFRKFW